MFWHSRMIFAIPEVCGLFDYVFRMYRSLNTLLRPGTPGCLAQARENLSDTEEGELAARASLAAIYRLAPREGNMATSTVLPLLNKPLKKDQALEPGISFYSVCTVFIERAFSLLKCYYFASSSNI